MHCLVQKLLNLYLNLYSSSNVSHERHNQALMFSFQHWLPLFFAMHWCNNMLATCRLRNIMTEKWAHALRGTAEHLLRGDQHGQRRKRMMTPSYMGRSMSSCYLCLSLCVWLLLWPPSAPSHSTQRKEATCKLKSRFWIFHFNKACIPNITFYRCSSEGKQKIIW